MKCLQNVSYSTEYTQDFTENLLFNKPVHEISTISKPKVYDIYVVDKKYRR